MWTPACPCSVGGGITRRDAWSVKTTERSPRSSTFGQEQSLISSKLGSSQIGEENRGEPRRLNPCEKREHAFMEYRAVIIMLIMANTVCGKHCDCKWILNPEFKAYNYLQVLQVL